MLPKCCQPVPCRFDADTHVNQSITAMAHIEMHPRIVFSKWTIDPCGERRKYSI